MVFAVNVLLSVASLVFKMGVVAADTCTVVDTSPADSLTLRVAVCSASSWKGGKVSVPKPFASTTTW